MTKELQILPEVNLPENATVFKQIGDKNMQVAHANNVNTTINIIVPAQRPTGKIIDTRFALCTEYYNLFVVGNETFADGHFIVPKDRALSILEGTSPEISAQFASLTSEAILKIKTFPSIFASENHQPGRTDDDHHAYYGFVTDITIQENGIKIYFQTFCAIPQQKLNEMAFSLAIKKASKCNELNRTHWTIKRIDLIEQLKIAGISVLAPT